MWTVVFMSRSKEKIDAMLGVLESGNILTRIRQANEDDFSDGAVYEILVPHTELEKAQEMIFDAELK